MRKTLAIIAGLAVLGLANFSIYSRERLIADGRTAARACAGRSALADAGRLHMALRFRTSDEAPGRAEEGTRG